MEAPVTLVIGGGFSNEMTRSSSISGPEREWIKLDVCARVQAAHAAGLADVVLQRHIQGEKV